MVFKGRLNFKKSKLKWVNIARITIPLDQTVRYLKLGKKGEEKEWYLTTSTNTIFKKVFLTFFGSHEKLLFIGTSTRKQ